MVAIRWILGVLRGRCNVCGAWGPAGENCKYPRCPGVYFLVRE